MSMTDTPASGDIWLVRFRFLDKPEVLKIRPAIVVSYREDTLCVAAAKVTSHAPRDNSPGDMTLEDWEHEGLAKPSCVRCSQVIEIPARLLLRHLGHLTPRDYSNFRATLRRLGVIE